MNRVCHHYRAACLTILLLAAVAPAAPTTQQSIDQLQADDPADRDAAEAQLCALGKPAIDPLMQATQNPHAEVRLRARRALRRIQLFLLPNVSPFALSIAQAYLDSQDEDFRRGKLNLLFQLQPTPTAVLTRLVALEPNEDLRRQILYRLRIDYRDQIGRMLVEDHDPKQVLELLNGAACMWGQSEGEAADDAAAQYLSGNIEEQIQIFQAEKSNGDSSEKEKAAAQLCFFYRVKGESNQALLAARESHEPALVFLVLSDQGDWDKAAQETDSWQNRMMAAAFHTALERLGGHPTQSLETLKSLASFPDTDDAFIPSKYLLLNDLPDRGMDLLVDRHPAAVFSMRVARGEISKALELAKKYANHPLEGKLLATLRDDLRRTLGELPDLPVPEEKPIADGPVAKAWRAAVSDLSQKKYQQAADGFETIWAADHTHFDRLYLQGYALKAAGQTERGSALIQTAEMVPLGDPLHRWQFAAQLDAAGLPDAAEEQRSLALRTGRDFDEVGFSEIYNTRAENAIEHKQWRDAANAVDRLCLINLSSQVQWQDPTRLLTIPALAHLLRSRELLEHGDLAAATRELDAYQNYLPASSEMILDCVPALDDLGQHQKADELFNGVFEKISAICQKYPNSLTYQNQLAWMCACCGRKLDAALSAAQAANRIKPDGWQVIDTLAEVNFRRGDRVAAIELEKRAAALANDPYLGRQLKRFESAAVPSTTQPGEAPE